MKTLVSILIVASSFILATGQTVDTAKPNVEKTAKPPSNIESKKLRDIPFPNGVDLQFLIKELARDLDLNVIFDTDTFRSPGRKTNVELKNVTVPEALDYILLKEGLYFEEAGPKTIIVSNRTQRTEVPQIGISVLPISKQLAQYFGVDSGILINTVRDDSPAAKAGLKAGDVIVEVDEVAVQGALGVIRVIDSKNEGEVTLKFVRDRNAQSVSLTAVKGIQSVL